MPRIDEMPQYRAKLPKYHHDLSHKLGFTATVAHLMPIFHTFVNPGETIKLGVNFNLRTQPVLSAAMVDIKSHVEYFFVPMSLLYEPFGSMYYNLNDNYSSLIPTAQAGGVQNQFPVLDFASLLNTVKTNNQLSSNQGQDLASTYMRLFDLLGYNSRINDGNIDTFSDANPNVFPYPILAYHCIYEYYYRLDNRQNFTQNLFNWDQFYNTPLVTLNTNAVNDLIRIHCRPKDSDYFTDIKVSPIVDVLNLNVKNQFDLAKNWLSRDRNTSVGVGNQNVLSSGTVGFGGNVNGSPNFVSNSPSTNIQTNFGFVSNLGSSDINNLSLNGFPNGVDINTANIRAMFASEKLWSITGRAKKHYDDQTLAHFGVNVPHDPKHEIVCFGHDRGSIHIGEVISTADTATASLGEIAGKGYGSLNSNGHKFTAPVHGVVMAILSFVPDVSYSNTYGKYNVMTNRHDLYTPEYDHLGMQPLFQYESGISNGLSSTIVGWQYRYEQWKRRYNRVTRAFWSGNINTNNKAIGNLDSWMLDFAAPYTNNAANMPNYLAYIHRPDELNQIMLTNYVTRYNDFDSSDTSSYLNDTLLYDGDPFIIDSFISADLVSTMSDYSLPRLDA